jgi:hypothetical protein
MGWLDRHAAPNWAIQLPPQDSAEEIAGWMERRGLKPMGTGWARFLRSTRGLAESAAASDLTVRALSVGEADHFGAVMVAGFRFPEWTAPWFSSLVGRPNWRIYVAFDGETPVGCGALYCDFDARWGWMGCDTTLASHRRRGAQAALILRRVADAAAAGIEAVTAETGQPAVGQEQNSHSYRNYHKAGFLKAYVRPNYRRV